MRQVACPVALHADGAPRRIPAFAHPHLGLQLVKGGIHDGEGPEAAAARELWTKAGLETRAALPVGQSTDIVEGECWHFALCRLVPPLRDRWQHSCTDDGGNLFRFFWLNLDRPAPDGFDACYMRAIDWINGSL